MPEVSYHVLYRFEYKLISQTFIFETTDLYNKRNVPKVIFGIHVLR
jgi:hypothetical protein